MTVFAPWRRRIKVAEGVRDDIMLWLAEYLAEYERATGLPPHALPPFTHAVVRHSSYVHPAEYANGPALVVWVAGVSDVLTDPNDSTVTGGLEIGVKLVVSGTRWTASEFLAHYQAVVGQLLADRTSAGGLATDLVLVDEDYTDFEASDEQHRCGVTLSYVAVGVDLVTRHSGPPVDGEPREDPYGDPWPDVETVATTDLGVTGISIIDPED